MAGDPAPYLVFHNIVDHLGRPFDAVNVRLLLEVVQGFNVEPGRHPEAQVECDGYDRSRGADNLVIKKNVSFL